MLIVAPKELDGKIRFHDNDVLIRDGVTLTEHEMELYRDFRKEHHEAILARFEE